MAETFNQALLDAMVGHQTGLLRFSGSVRNQIWKLLDSTEAEIKQIILASEDAGLESAAQVRNLDQMLGALRKTRDKTWTKAIKIWFKEMNALSKAEPEFFDRIIGTAFPVELGSTLPSAEVLRDIVTSKPFMGKTVRAWSRKLRADDINRIEDAIRIGLVQKESVRQLARRIVGTIRLRGRDGVTQITRRQAAAIVRTITAGIAAEAREAYLQENKDLAPKKVFTATLDSRTTPICQRFDGQVFDVDDDNAPVFPLHFGERSLYSPALDGQIVGTRPRRDFTQRQLLREFAEEEGISPVTKRKNLPFGKKGAFDKFARARMRELTGVTPARTTYQQWLNRRTAAQQDDILGATRGALFRRGGLTLDRFVLTDGTELTLQQLAQRNAEAFRKANLDPDDFL